MNECKWCGADIIWAKNESNKLVSLDAKAPVYVLTIKENPGMTTRCQIAEKGRAFVSHLSICPKANELSEGEKNEHSH